jgi:hypothetical protein
MAAIAARLEELDRVVFALVEARLKAPYRGPALEGEHGW